MERDNRKKHKWLCEDHIKLFNKNWNYFEGMSQHEIEDFVKSDLTWHRPTQKFGSYDNFFNILWNNALSDKFNLFKEEKLFLEGEPSDNLAVEQFHYFLMRIQDMYFNNLPTNEEKNKLNVD